MVYVVTGTPLHRTYIHFLTLIVGGGSGLKLICIVTDLGEGQSLCDGFEADGVRVGLWF
jgi:hypothetical protein